MKAFLALVFTVACIVSHAYSQTQSDPNPLGTLYIVSSPAVPSVKLEDIAAKVAQGLNQDPSSPFVVESIYHPDPSKANLDVILAGLRKNQPTHFHPNDEFHFPVLGNSGTFAEKTTFFMAPGDCAVMPHNTNHFLGNIPAANTPWALTVSVFTPNPVELTPTQAPIPTPSPQSTLRQSFATGSFFTLEKTTNLLELAQTGLSSSSNSLQKLYNTDLTSQFLWIVNNDVVNIDFGKAFFAVILNGGCDLVTDPSDPSKSVSISEKDMFLVHKDTAYTLNNAKELVMVLDFEENVELADLLAILRAGASPSGTSAPNYTPTPSAVPSTYVYTTPAYSPTYIPSYAPSYAASYTPTYEATSTYTPTYTATYTPTYTATYTPTYTSTYAPTYTPTYAATYTPTYQATYTATYAATYTPTYTSTYAPTYAATYAPTYAATPTYTVAYTPTGY